MEATATRRRRRLAVLAALGVIALAVGTWWWASVATGALAVPTSASLRPDHHAVFSPGAPPAFTAVRHGDLVCFFGDDRRHDLLVLPAGYSASPDLALRDEHGRDVAQPGSAVGIAFADVSVTAPPACGGSGGARAVVRIEGLTG